MQRCECVSGSKNASPVNAFAGRFLSIYELRSDFKHNKTNTRHAASGMADLIAIRNYNQASLTLKCIVIIPARKEIVNSFDLALFGSLLLMLKSKNALAESIITSETNSAMMVL